MRTAWDRIKPILELLARSMESDGPVRLAVVLCRPGPVPGSRGKVEVEADWHAMSVTGSDWLAAVPSRMVVEDGSSGGGGTAGFPLARGLFVALESIVADRGTSPSTSAEPGCRDHVIVAFAGRCVWHGDLSPPLPPPQGHCVSFASYLSHVSYLSSCLQEQRLP